MNINVCVSTTVISVIFLCQNWSVGVVPPAGAISWLATVSTVALQSNAGVMSSAQVQVVMPSVILVWSTLSTPSVAPVCSGGPGFSGLPLMPVFPAGTYVGEDLLPIPEYLTKKILQLEFVKMWELMPDLAQGWGREHEEHAGSSATKDRTCHRHTPCTMITTPQILVQTIHATFWCNASSCGWGLSCQAACLPPIQC